MVTMSADKNGNLRIPYLGGEILLRKNGKFVNDEGKEIELTEAIKISRGSVSTVIPFEAFASLVDAAYTFPDVNEYLKKHGINLKKALL